MIQLHAFSRLQIESQPLPGPCAVVCMADSEAQLARIHDSANVMARLNLIFNDATDGFDIVRPPTIEHAQRILQFFREQSGRDHFVCQCQVGLGRSMGVVAAIMKINNADPKSVLRRGTYNRGLYRKLLAAAGVPPEPEPLVSMAVRVKYAPDRLALFLLSMRRQRHENWEVVAVTDGPNAAAAAVVEQMNDPRVRLIQTEKPLGHWGHPYRQLGIDACRGQFIGLSNDDNYYVPGYFEQMLFALESADMAICRIVHSYASWGVVEVGTDLGSWIARAELVRQVPWPGWEFTSDKVYTDALKALAKDRVATIESPLFVHN
jgi:hypothetical protein